MAGILCEEGAPGGIEVCFRPPTPHISKQGHSPAQPATSAGAERFTCDRNGQFLGRTMRQNSLPTRTLHTTALSKGDTRSTIPRLLRTATAGASTAATKLVASKSKSKKERGSHSSMRELLRRQSDTRAPEILHAAGAFSILAPIHKGHPLSPNHRPLNATSTSSQQSHPLPTAF